MGQPGTYTVSPRQPMTRAQKNRAKLFADEKPAAAKSAAASKSADSWGGPGRPWR